MYLYRDDVIDKSGTIFVLQPEMDFFGRAVVPKEKLAANPATGYMFFKEKMLYTPSPPIPPFNTPFSSFSR